MIVDVLKRRYADGYMAADWTIAAAKVIRKAGLILGALLLLLGADQVHESFLEGMLIAACGIGFAAMAYVFSVLLAAFGQIILAAFDTAVNTSPILGPDDKTEILTRT